MPSVLQPWLTEIPIRMQSTLLLGLRGPDTHKCTEVKKVTRWLRGLVFVPGNPANCKEFMAAEYPQSIVEKSDIAKELEFCTQHYYSHLMHALQVVGYNHPINATRICAYNLYYDMCSLFHLPIEDKFTFEKRLGTIYWPGGKQPISLEEALTMIE